jgi:cell division protein FtsQ
MRRIALGLVGVAVLAVAVYWFALRGSSTPEAQAQPLRPVAQIGEGKKVILVDNDGKLLGGFSTEGGSFPVLPIKKKPKGGRVRGHTLEEVRVLSAAPKPLRRYIASTSYGDTGVDVELSSGIKIRFGDQREAERKWKAAAAVLADPSVTLLSYVDVQAPARPAIGGEGHELPAPESK